MELLHYRQDSDFEWNSGDLMDTGGTSVDSEDGIISLNTWHHVAYCKIVFRMVYKKWIN